MTGYWRSAPAAIVSASPWTPKSSPWLLASETASTPAVFSASSATGGARKLYFLGWTASPPSVTAVSRLTTATSAAESTGAIDASRPFGSSTSLARSAPSNITSPPNANVTASPLPRIGSRVVVDVVGAVDTVVVDVEVVGAAEPSVPSSRVTAHAAVAPATSTMHAAPTSRRRLRARRRRCARRDAREVARRPAGVTADEGTPRSIASLCACPA